MSTASDAGSWAGAITMISRLPGIRHFTFWCAARHLGQAAYLFQLSPGVDLNCGKNVIYSEVPLELVILIAPVRTGKRVTTIGRHPIQQPNHGGKST